MRHKPAHDAGKDASLNVKGAYLEVWADMIGSVGVIIGALIIRYTGWTWVDAVVEGADVFFPRFDPAAWREVGREHHPADAAHACAFDFVDYVRA